MQKKEQKSFQRLEKNLQDELSSGYIEKQVKIYVSWLLPAGT